MIEADTENPQLDVSFIVEVAKVDENEARKRVDDTVKAVEAGHHVYMCIERRTFAIPRIQKHHAYDKVKSLVGNSDFRLLEIGCCIGTDIRRLIMDGLSPSRLVVSDLHGEYWKIGRDVLFRDNLELPSIWLDFADASIEVTSHTLLSQPFSAVSAQSILHVFSKTQSRTFLTNVQKVLRKGGFIFGTTAISAGDEGFEWGETPSEGLKNRKIEPRWLYSKDGLKQFFEEIGFENVEIEKTKMTRSDADKTRDRVSFIAYKS